MKCHRRSLAATLGGAVLAGSLALGMVSATPATAAPSSPAATASAPSSQLDHLLRGSEVTFVNRSQTDVFVPGHGWISPGHRAFFEGANDHHDDVAFKVITADHLEIPIYVHNPLSSSAYLQVEGTKMEFDGIVSSQGKNFAVDYIPEGIPGPAPVTLATTGAPAAAAAPAAEAKKKRWVLEYLDTSRPWAHEHIHHLGEDDGVKGFIVNHTGADLKMRIGGHIDTKSHMTLRDGERMMFFDAHELDSGRGTNVQILTPSGNGVAYFVELGDPFIGFAHAKVWNARSELIGDEGLSEGDTRSYISHPSHKDSYLHLKREKDQSLPTEHDSYKTRDWATFTLELTGRS
ncbi:MAG: hypothetical protein ACH36H_04075 [Candidatus Nanopelagicales bacterium]